MIEGGAIDWASHDNSIARQIEEEIEFNEAVEAVVKWVKTKNYPFLFPISSDNVKFLYETNSCTKINSQSSLLVLIPLPSQWNVFVHLLPYYFRKVGYTKL